MEKQITENDVREFFRKRDEEISKAIWEKQSELSKKTREMSEDKDFAVLAAQSKAAMFKAMEETRDLVLLCFGVTSMYTKPFYCRHLKLIASAMEAPGEDSEYFKETTNLLNAVFRSEAISIPANMKER